MGLLTDRQIRDLCVIQNMIKPFTRQVSSGVISYGLSSFGYDIRVGRKYKVFTNARCAVIDPKNIDTTAFIEVEADYCLIPPNSFALAETVETFDMPRNVLGICVGKSTYARAGILINVTPLEPEWRGILTLEISNTTPLPAKIYSNEGIAQLLFFEADEAPELSYEDRKGKYQDQKGLTLPFVAK